jgi:hypothetical protein
MEEICLTRNEQWLLRHFNAVCPTASADSAVTTDHRFWEGIESERTAREPPNSREMRGQIASRITVEEWRTAMMNLHAWGLVGENHGKSWITAKGRQYLRSEDHPDIVEKFQRWSRRKPTAAHLVIAGICLGGLAGFISLFWNVAEVLIRYVEVWVE